MGLFGSKESAAYKVEGMTCQHCVMHVTKALEGVDGVKRAKVDLKKGEAEVEFKKDKVDFLRLKGAVEEAGYALSE